MDTLNKLFGNSHRVRLLRLFYLNPGKTIALKEAAKLSKVSSAAAAREIRLLSSIGFLKNSVRTDEYLKKVKSQEKVFTKKIHGFALSTTFPLLSALENLVVTASPVSREKILNYFRSKGKIKMVALGGVFGEKIGAELNAAGVNSGLDMLVVGNGVTKVVLESFVDRIGAEVGKELAWAYMPEAEFEQRLSVRDKFLREFFDAPHEFLVDKLGMSEKVD